MRRAWTAGRERRARACRSGRRRRSVPLPLPLPLPLLPAVVFPLLSTPCFCGAGLNGSKSAAPAFEGAAFSLLLLTAHGSCVTST